MSDNETPMNGWIKLSRGIQQNWVWNNPNWLKWWLDLLLLAAWEDTEIRKRRQRVQVKRGEVLMSVRELQRRWGVKSSYAVRYFINSLLEEGMVKKIRRESVAHFIAHSVAHSVAHPVAHSVAHSVAHFFTVIKICNYDSYQDFALGSLLTFEHTSLHKNKTTSLHEKPHFSPHPIIKNIKNNISSSSTRACAREEVLAFDDLSFHDEMLSEGKGSLLESACAEMKISMADARELCGQIVRDWVARKILHKDRSDAVAHFFSQMRKKVASMRSEAAGSSREAARASARAQAEAAMRAAMGSGTQQASEPQAPEPEVDLLRRPPDVPASDDATDAADELEARWQAVDLSECDYDDYDELR